MPTRLVIPRIALVALLLLLVVVLGGIWAFVYLPHATITIQTATVERSVSQDITLSTSATAPDFVRFILPAKLVEKTVDQTQTIDRSAGTTTEDFAKGTITLHNDQDSEQRLLPRTHLRHEASGVFFLTDQAVAIPPHGTVTVGVTAQEKGVSGNVSQGRFIVDKLPTSLQKVVYGDSQTDLSGGLSVDKPLTQEELDQAKEKLRQTVLDKAHGELTAAANGAVIRPELINIDVQSEDSSADVGSRTTSFTLHTTVTARGFIVDDTDLLNLTLLALRSSPKPDEDFVSYKPDSFKVQIIKSDFSRGEARFKGTLTGTFAPKTEPAVFNVDNLAGRSKPEIEEYFKQYPSVGQVDVKFSPFWVRTVPTRSQATEIIVKNTP